MKRREKLPEMDPRDEALLGEFLMMGVAYWTRPYVIWNREMTKVVMVVAKGGEA